MVFTDFCLKNFRCYKEKKLHFNKGINVIVGKNAVGKTTILEGIFYLCVTKSFRSALDRELCAFGETDFSLCLNVKSRNEEREICAKWENGRKSLFINGIKKEKRSEFVGQIKCVLFAPEHLLLIKGSPTERRRFMDMGICQISPNYYMLLSTYQKLLEQKNILLRRGQNQSSDALLSVYNERLAPLNVAIMRARGDYLSRIEAFAIKTHLEISKGIENLKVDYTPAFDIASNEEQVFRELERKKEREYMQKSSSFGVHRDDFTVKINGFEAKLFASQGQVRSSVLSLKMAECSLLKEEFGESPVLLLDDILSELDAFRKKYVLNHLDNMQVIITCCENRLRGRNATIIKL